MPSSGARSGTQPSRSERGAGDGRIEDGVVELRCGHRADAEPVIVYPRKLRRYWCEECRTLVAER